MVADRGGRWTCRRVLESATGLPLTQKLRHDGPILDAAFRPDSRGVA